MIYGKNEGYIHEIFKSIQGEGLFAGKGQVFVRFYGCNLKCAFCDTPQKAFFKKSKEELYKKVKSFHQPFVSITGGEPLLQADFLSEFLPLLKKDRFKIYLDTNASLPGELVKIIDLIDICAFDIKLPTSSKEKDLFKEHAECLKIASGKQTFVKAVITSDTSFDDINKCVDIIASESRAIPLVFQPEWNSLGSEVFKKIEDFKQYAREKLDDVRFIPQMHRILCLK